MFREISLNEIELVAGGNRSASSVDDDSGYYQTEISTGDWEWQKSINLKDIMKYINSQISADQKVDGFKWGDFKITCCSLGPLSMDVFTHKVPLIESLKEKVYQYTGKVFMVGDWTCRETIDGAVCSTPGRN
jgi:hypothetical protein